MIKTLTLIPMLLVCQIAHGQESAAEYLQELAKAEDDAQKVDLLWKLVAEDTEKKFEALKLYVGSEETAAAVHGLSPQLIQTCVGINSEMRQRVLDDILRPAMQNTPDGKFQQRALVALVIDLYLADEVPVFEAVSAEAAAEEFLVPREGGPIDPAVRSFVEQLNSDEADALFDSVPGDTKQGVILKSGIAAKLSAAKADAVVQRWNEKQDPTDFIQLVVGEVYRSISPDFAEQVVAEAIDSVLAGKPLGNVNRRPLSELQRIPFYIKNRFPKPPRPPRPKVRPKEDARRQKIEPEEPRLPYGWLQVSYAFSRVTPAVYDAQSSRIIEALPKLSSRMGQEAISFWHRDTQRMSKENKLRLAKLCIGNLVRRDGKHVPREVPVLASSLHSSLFSVVSTRDWLRADQILPSVRVSYSVTRYPLRDSILGMSSTEKRGFFSEIARSKEIHPYVKWDLLTQNIAHLDADSLKKCVSEAVLEGQDRFLATALLESPNNKGLISRAEYERLCEEVCRRIDQDSPVGSLSVVFSLLEPDDRKRWAGLLFSKWQSADVKRKQLYGYALFRCSEHLTAEQVLLLVDADPKRVLKIFSKVAPNVQRQLLPRLLKFNWHRIENVRQFKKEFPQQLPSDVAREVYLKLLKDFHYGRATKSDAIGFIIAGLVKNIDRDDRKPLVDATLKILDEVAEQRRPLGKRGRPDVVAFFGALRGLGPWLEKENSRAFEQTLVKLLAKIKKEDSLAPRLHGQIIEAIAALPVPPQRETVDACLDSLTPERSLPGIGAFLTKDQQSELIA